MHAGGSRRRRIKRSSEGKERKDSPEVICRTYIIPYKRLTQSGAFNAVQMFPHYSLAPPAKRQKMSAPTASPVRVAIELGYQDLMTDMVWIIHEPLVFTFNSILLFYCVLYKFHTAWICCVGYSKSPKTVPEMLCCQQEGWVTTASEWWLHPISLWAYQLCMYVLAVVCMVHSSTSQVLGGAANREWSRQFKATPAGMYVHRLMSKRK